MSPQYKPSALGLQSATETHLCLQVAERDSGCHPASQPPTHTNLRSVLPSPPRLNNHSSAPQSWAETLILLGYKKHFSWYVTISCGGSCAPHPCSPGHHTLFLMPEDQPGYIWPSLVMFERSGQLFCALPGIWPSLCCGGISTLCLPSMSQVLCGHVPVLEQGSDL